MRVSGPEIAPSNPDLYSGVNGFGHYFSACVIRCHTLFCGRRVIQSYPAIPRSAVVSPLDVALCKRQGTEEAKAISSSSSTRLTHLVFRSRAARARVVPLRVV